MAKVRPRRICAFPSVLPYSFDGLRFSQRLNSQFGTAVVLTTIWVELVNDPKLLALKLVKSRDHRLLAVFFVFLGGMCSAGIVFASSSAVAFAACTGASPSYFHRASPGVLLTRDRLRPIGLRLISMLMWLVVPIEKAA